MTTRWLHGRLPSLSTACCRLGASIVILAAMSGLFYAAPGVAQGKQKAVNPRSARASPGQPSRVSPVSSANQGYVGSEACSRCHAEIYNHFSKTAMGRSMTPATPEYLRQLPLPASYYDPTLNR